MRKKNKIVISCFAISVVSYIATYLLVINHLSELLSYGGLIVSTISSMIGFITLFELTD